jgi:molecular chaperone GrpE (heat shock protein)
MFSLNQKLIRARYALLLANRKNTALTYALSAERNEKNFMLDMTTKSITDLNLKLLKQIYPAANAAMIMQNITLKPSEDSAILISTILDSFKSMGGDILSPKTGEIFDPLTMVAVEVRASSNMIKHTIIDVISYGYTANEMLARGNLKIGFVILKSKVIIAGE